MAVWKAPQQYVPKVQSQRPQQRQVSSLSLQSLMPHIIELAQKYGVDPMVLLAVVVQLLQSGGGGGLQGLGPELLDELRELLEKLAKGDNPNGQTSQQLVELLADVLNQLGQRHNGDFLSAAGEMAGGQGEANGPKGRRFQEDCLRQLGGLGLPTEHLLEGPQKAGGAGGAHFEDSFQALSGFSPMVELNPKPPGPEEAIPGTEDHEVSQVRHFIKELQP
jgi:hypothetical protein